MDKIVHFVLDDEEIVNITNDIWYLEYFQERKRWEKFLNWNKAHNNYFK